MSLGLLLALTFAVMDNSRLSLAKFGSTFLVSIEWNPATDEYGALPFIYGVYTCAIFPFPDRQRQAWADAPVLTGIVLTLELGVR